MKRICLIGAAGLLLAIGAAPLGAAPSRQDLLREVLRQQSSAERSSCKAIRQAIGGGSDVDLVVRTAIELGYAPCPVIRCAVEGGADLGKVIEGASAAGTTPEVVSHCAIDAGADPGAVAALVADRFRDPSFCYFGPEGGSSDSALPPTPPGGTQRYDQPEFSRFQP